MKSPVKLQEKLRALLKGNRHIHLRISASPWTDRELKDAAWVVEGFVNSNPEVIECEPLKDWVEEYKFYLADSK